MEKESTEQGGYEPQKEGYAQAIIRINQEIIHLKARLHALEHKGRDE